MGKGLVILAVLLALAFLFTLPPRTLDALAEAILPAAEEALAAADREDWEAAAALLEGMHAAFSERKTALQLFLRHEEVRELEVSLAAGAHLARAGDDGQFRMELVHATALLESLIAQERLEIETLL